MSELVTGEAVALGLRPARLPTRALAVSLDAAVYLGSYLAVSFGLLLATSSLDGAATAAISTASLVLILIGVPVAVETLTHGRSLGKMAFGLRVVRDDGGPIRFRHALVRTMVGVVEILMSMGVIACLASLVSARGRRVGDVFAGTLVVRERVPVRTPLTRFRPPPEGARPLAGADLSAVPDGLWLAVRQYLGRAAQLDPRVGELMARRLAADVAERVGTPAPPEVPAVAYLAAVVTERRTREAQRVFGVVPSPVRPAAVPGPASVTPAPAVSAHPRPAPAAAAGPSVTGFAPPA